MEKNNEKYFKTALKYGKIMGIKVLSTSMSQVLASIEKFITHNTRFYITTPNPEFVLMAQKNTALKEALNSSDLPIPDGIGLAQASRFLSLSAPKNLFLRFIVTFFQGLSVGIATFLNKKWLLQSLNILKGREVNKELIKLARKKGWRVFFLGGLEGEAEKAAAKLQIPDSKIQTFAGPKLNSRAEPLTQKDVELQKEAIDRINIFAPQLLFVAFGNPRQEIWIHKNLSRLKTGGAMTVGGSFRYIAGLSKLPPKWIDNLGLEWVWRLIMEPWRFRRILNAWPIFPLKIWNYKLWQTRA